MKKIGIFLTLFVGFFCWTSNYAQAETKVFKYYPEPEKGIGEDLWGVVKNVLSLSENAIAETITSSEKQNAHSFDDHAKFGSTDKLYGFSTPKESWYTSDMPIKMRSISCGGGAPTKNNNSSLLGFLSNISKEYLTESALARAGNCYEPEQSISTYYPYYVSEAKIVTDTADNILRNDKDCKADIFITPVGNCADNVHNPHNYGSKADYCWNDGGKTVTAVLDTSNLGKETMTACAHIRLEDTKEWFSQVQWGGHIEIVGKRGSLDKFAITGVEATTGTSKTITSNQTLQICKNTGINIEWRTSDGVGEVRLLGGSNDDWRPLSSVNGSISDIPQNETTYYLQYKSYTGSGFLWQLAGPITIVPVDCQGALVSLVANPSFLSVAGKSTLTWGSSGMESCWAVNAGGGWSGTLPDVNGSKEVNVSETTTYKIQCRSALDHKTIQEAQATVTIGGAGYCDYTKNTDEKGHNDACTGTTKCCNKNNRCEMCQTNITTGTLDVRVRLNGAEVSGKAAGSPVFSFVGLGRTLERGAPNSLVLAANANYSNFLRVSGGPVGSTFVGFSQSSVVLTAGQTSTLYMDFRNGDSALRVVPRLNGQEITTPTAIVIGVTGPETLNTTELPQTFNNIIAGNYNLNYVSGGPENSTFLGFSPAQSVLVSSGITTTVYVDFTDGAGLCNITVQAIKTSCDGSGQSPWTGALSYGLLGPAILNGMTVDQTFENIPSGRYYLTSLVGGPGTYNGVSPGNPIACPSGSNVTLQMRFKDCGETHYKCNYSTGACESCDVYSSDCKYSVFNDCKTQCSGCTGPHTPVANVFCWANFDSETCTGVNDGNANTPSVILYDKSSDECGDAESCHWKIYDSSGNLIKSADTCAPYPWYDETPGTYTGELTVTDSQGNSSTDRQKFIIKNIDTLTCNFVWDPTSPTASGVTSFFDQTLTPSGTSLKSWSWTFEGATPASSTAQNISNVKFNSAGAKTITLTVKNSANKTCTISKQIQVKTINPYWKEVIPD